LRFFGFIVEFMVVMGEKTAKFAMKEEYMGYIAKEKWIRWSKSGRK